MKNYLFYPFRAIIFTLGIYGILGNANAQVQVNNFSGSPLVQLPLWNVSSKDISYPIVLSYQSKGIKVGSGSGRVGMGWGISSGGSISRLVKGLPDDVNTTLRKGWLHGTSANSVQGFTPVADQDYSDSSDEAADYAALTTYAGFDSTTTMLDTEPDIFYINVPGISGKFVFDGQGNAQVMPYQDLSIEKAVDATSRILSFKITNTKGVTYNFTLATTTGIDTSSPDVSKIMFGKSDYYYYHDGVNFNSNWYLTSITSLQGGNVTFGYGKPAYYTGPSYYHTFSWSPNYRDSVSGWFYSPSSNNSKEYTFYYKDYTEEQPYSLASINAEGIEVEFMDGLIEVPILYNNYSGDWRLPPVDLRRPLLNMVNIYEKTVSERWLTKKFIFEYKYFSSPQVDPISQQANSVYPFLLSVRESTLWKDQPPYRFEYFNLDYNTSEVFLPSRNAHQTQDYFGYYNAGLIKSSRLPKIYIYPDEPDANRYRHLPIPNYIGPVFVLNGRNVTEDIRALHSGVLSKITYPSGGSSSITYEPNTYYDPQTQNDEYGGGLRVKEVRVHDGMSYGNDIIRKYSYQFNGQSTGKLQHYPRYAFTLGLFINPDDSTHKFYHELAGDDDFMKAKKLTIRTGNDQARNLFSGNSGVGYTQVTVSQDGAGSTQLEYLLPASYGELTNGDWSVGSTRLARPSLPLVSYYGLAPMMNNFGYPFAPQTNISYKKGLLKKSSIYNEDNILMSESENIYTYLPAYQSVQGIKIDKIKAMGQIGGFDAETEMFIYSPYTLRAMTRTLLASTTNTVYAPDNLNLSQESISVNSYATGTPYLKSNTRTVSDGTIYKSYIKYNHEYAFDSSSTDPFVQTLGRMSLDTIWGLPIESYQTVKAPGDSEKVTGARLQLYSYASGNKLFASGTQSLRINAPLTDFDTSGVNQTTWAFNQDNRYQQATSVEETDRYGNIATTKAYTKQQGTVLYGYGGLIPLMQIQGASYSSVAFSNFENNVNVTVNFEDFDFTFVDSAWSASPFTTGRLNGQSLIFKTGANFKLTRDGLVRDDNHSLYKFSCWISTSTAATLTITADDGTTQETANLNITSDTNWTYYDIDLDLSSLGTSFKVEITTSAEVNIDDMVLVPDAAIISYTTLGNGLLKLGQTDGQGRTTTFEYDDTDRLKIVRDYQGNIVQRKTYTLPETTGRPVIDFNGRIYTNEDHIFTALTRNVQGSTFYWDLVPASTEPVNDPSTHDFTTPTATMVDDNQVSLTIPTSNKYVIFLKVTDGNGDLFTKLVIESYEVVTAPLELSVCVEGPLEIDYCGIEHGYSYQCPGKGLPGGTTFFVEYSGGVGTRTIEWYTTTIDPSGGLYNHVLVSSTDKYFVAEIDYPIVDTWVICIVKDSETPPNQVNNIRMMDVFHSDPFCAIE